MREDPIPSGEPGSDTRGVSKRKTLGPLGLLGIGTALFIAAGIVATLSLYLARPLLMVESGPPHADILVILDGDFGDRTRRALELYQAGAAPRILITGNYDSQRIKNHLIQGGIDPHAILVEPHAANTRQNAEFSTQLMRDHGIHSALIVTSWFHSRRALAWFRYYGTELTIGSYPASHRQLAEHASATSRVRLVFREYAACAWALVTALQLSRDNLSLPRPDTLPTH